MKFIRIIINAEDDKTLDTILQRLATTLPEDRHYISDDGDDYVHYETEEELFGEAICLGICFSDIEHEDDIEEPFEMLIEEHDAPPGVPLLSLPKDDDAEPSPNLHLH